MSNVEIWNEDCVMVLDEAGAVVGGMAARLGDESVHCIVSSIPFGALFSYSSKAADIGNNRDGVDMAAGEFGLHMRFFLAQAFRVLAPGGIFCCHVQQLSTTVVQHGWIGMRDFRGAVIELAMRHGFLAHGEVAIPKNPQRIAQVRKLHSLLFVTGKRDSRRLAPAPNDYVLFFKKPGEGVPVPGLVDGARDLEVDAGNFTKADWIRWARGVWEDAWAGEDEDLQLDGYRQVRDLYLAQEWRDEPVWGDILEIDTLDGWRSARGSDEEKHVCPLQLEVIRRCLLLYTNRGDVVLDPFMGIGSTAYVAVELGRSCVGFELKESYHAMTLRNVQLARERFQRRTGQRDLFEPEAAGA